jgi:hypothetical protein
MHVFANEMTVCSEQLNTKELLVMLRHNKVLQQAQRSLAHGAKHGVSVIAYFVFLVSQLAQSLVVLYT